MIQQMNMHFLWLRTSNCSGFAEMTAPTMASEMYVGYLNLVTASCKYLNRMGLNGGGGELLDFEGTYGQQKTAQLRRATGCSALTAHPSLDMSHQVLVSNSLRGGTYYSMLTHALVGRFGVKMRGRMLWWLAYKTQEDNPAVASPRAQCSVNLNNCRSRMIPLGDLVTCPEGQQKWQHLS